MMQNRLSTFNFKKLIKIIFTVALAVIITIVLDRIFAPKYVNENLDGRITAEFYREEEPLDLIAFGSSTVYNAIDTDKLNEELGIHSYLRANASQTLWQSYYLLKDSLIDQNPELIMLDVSFIKNGEEFIEEPSNRKCIENMRPSIYKYKAIKESMYHEEHPETYFLPVFRYHSRWKELGIDDLKYAFYIPNVTKHGYIREDGVAKDQKIYEPDPENENALLMKYEGAEDLMNAGVFPDKAVKYLDMFVDECAKKNIPLMLFKTPTYVANWYSAYDNWLEDYVNHKNSQFKANGSSYSIDYVNYDEYADKMGIVVSEDYYDDGEHLNHSGATKFSSYLIDDLKAKYPSVFK